MLAALGVLAASEPRYAWPPISASLPLRSRLSATVSASAGLSFSIELADVLEDRAVVGAVEIGLGDEIGDPVPRRVVEQQSAENGLLGFDRLGRNSRGFDLGVLDDRGNDLSHERCSSQPYRWGRIFDAIRHGRCAGNACTSAM